MEKIIATRADLDSLFGTPDYDNFLSFLAGTLFRLERTGNSWAVVEDDSTIARYNFTRADFPDALPPEFPVIPIEDQYQINYLMAIAQFKESKLREIKDYEDAGNMTAAIELRLKYGLL